MRYFFGEAPFQLASYALVANTGRVPLDDVVAAVVALVRENGAGGPVVGASEHRVLTLARELGAGETGFALTLAERLGLRVFDRELLEHLASRLGVAQGELAQVDEKPSGILQRFLPGSLHQRSFEALGQVMNELAQQGQVLIVGRGGSRFLRDHPSAFHVRLVAAMDVRIQRVMAHRWLREEPARQLVAESDSQRGRFYQDSFGADWGDPLGYHLVVNSIRLGPATVDLVAFAAGRFWSLRKDGETGP